MKLFRLKVPVNDEAKISNTLHIIKLLSEGERVKLPEDIYEIGMAENGQIGYVYYEEGIVGDFCFSSLVQMFGNLVDLEKDDNNDRSRTDVEPISKS